MSYSKTNWNTAPLSKTNMNKIENELATLDSDKMDSSKINNGNFYTKHFATGSEQNAVKITGTANYQIFLVFRV